MIQIDARIGGQDPRYVLYPFDAEVKPLVRVPDELMKCVVFLGYRKQRIFTAAGTGVFIARPSPDRKFAHTYLITAKHVIDGIRTKGDGQVVIRVNLREGGAGYFDSDVSYWQFHPDDYQVDIAFAAIGIPEEADHLVFPIGGIAGDDIIRNEGIGVGDEVFLAGLFEHHQENARNFPIIRVGNIAGLPKERFPLDGFGPSEVYFIEARSIGGLSGSPVFVQPDTPRLANAYPAFAPTDRPKLALYQRPLYLLGLTHGHIGQKAKDHVLNVGIAIVIPGFKILEAICQASVLQSERELEAKLREEQTTIAVMDETESS